MSYTDSRGRYVDEVQYTLAASAARTATANGSAVLLGRQRHLSLVLNITAHGGTTPTLDVVVQTSNDGTAWRTLATFTQATSDSGDQRIGAGGADKYVRATWTIGGTTPSFTFSVTATAV